MPTSMALVLKLFNQRKFWLIQAFISSKQVLRVDTGDDDEDARAADKAAVQQDPPPPDDMAKGEHV